MQTIIQVIETQWTKLSRGQPGSEARNQVPEVFRFPKDFPDEKILLHHVVYTERNSFAKAIESPVVALTGSEAEKWRVSVNVESTGVEVSFFGVPFSPTSGRPKNVAHVPLNSWMQIVGNRRISDDSGWAYRKYVYNIFHGDLLLANDILKSSAAACVFRHEEHLW